MVRKEKEENLKYFNVDFSVEYDRKKHFNEKEMEKYIQSLEKVLNDWSQKNQFGIRFLHIRDSRTYRSPLK